MNETPYRNVQPAGVVSLLTQALHVGSGRM